MALTHIPFASMPWESGTHPLERKKTWFGGDACLLEFAVGFSDPIWCERAHCLYVLDGSLGLELAGREVTVLAGECALLDAKTPHRAKNVGNRAAIVFVVSPAASQAGEQRSLKA